MEVNHKVIETKMVEITLNAEEKHFLCEILKFYMTKYSITAIYNFALELKDNLTTKVKAIPGEKEE